MNTSRLQGVRVVMLDLMITISMEVFLNPLSHLVERSPRFRGLRDDEHYKVQDEIFAHHSLNSYGGVAVGIHGK
jgi:hypothetical protein